MALAGSETEVKAEDDGGGNGGLLDHAALALDPAGRDATRDRADCLDCERESNASSLPPETPFETRDA